MNKNKYIFPKDFFWGTSTASHQVEGGNNNDWTEWEKENAKRLASQAYDKYNWLDIWSEIQKEATDLNNYISKDACDHYHRYEKDFDLMQELNLNSYRFSIEWSRIEPKEGEFNEKEIQHYKKFIAALRSRNIEPFVTIWHWPIPLWLSEKGGWQNPKISFYFQRYTEKLVKNLDVKYWITLNEPHIYSALSYFRGEWAPQKKSFFAYYKVINNMIEAHKKAFITIKKYSKDTHIGIAKNNIGLRPYKNAFYNRIAIWLVDWWWNKRFLNRINKHMDFIGLNYYFNEIKDIFGRDNNLKKEYSDIGFEINPSGIYSVLMDLKRYNKPVFITESGLADATDIKREDYIKTILINIHKAITSGLNVQGHFYWSFMDNFEWDKGFWPKFGLVSIDRKNNLERKIKKSAYAYAKIAKSNCMEL